jgi:hypothetical protein
MKTRNLRIERALVGLAMLVGGATVAAVAFLAAILIGSDERVPAWLWALVLAGVVVAVCGIAALVASLTRMRG